MRKQYGRIGGKITHWGSVKQALAQPFTAPQSDGPCLPGTVPTMASPTPNTQHPAPSDLPGGIHVDETLLAGHVIVTLRTHCGHTAEVATMDKRWYEAKRAAGQSIDLELLNSLHAVCAPLDESVTCGRCPFSSAASRPFPRLLP